MPLYDKPVWKLMYDMADDFSLEGDTVFTKNESIEWFRENYPKVKKSTITAHLTKLSTNASSRIHYNARPGDDDLFYKLTSNTYRLYSPEKDPSPIYEEKIEKEEMSPLQEAIDKIQKFENMIYEELDYAHHRIEELEKENKLLKAKLKKSTSVLDEVSDEVLKERMSRLGSAPSDTIIREAGVVLEDRLRQIAGTDSMDHGIKLVDAVLNPQDGVLIFSSHPGEQDGVRMLYRGAMQFIRNPPMHKLMDYTEGASRLFIRLIDSLLLLITELKPHHRGKGKV